MGLNSLDEIEEKSEIDLNWFYHSTDYDKAKYTSILTEGIKCNALLENPGNGRYNGKYHISLSKITIPDNECFLTYTTDTPSFILDGIEPIKCQNIAAYWEYLNTCDPRRIGHHDEEYQYYYFIENTHIKGIVYDLSEKFFEKNNLYTEIKRKKLLELIALLEELKLDIPLYDYARRERTLAHKINKEKLKEYSRNIDTKKA